MKATVAASSTFFRLSGVPRHPPPRWNQREGLHQPLPRTLRYLLVNAESLIRGVLYEYDTINELQGGSGDFSTEAEYLQHAGQVKATLNSMANLLQMLVERIAGQVPGGTLGELQRYLITDQSPAGSIGTKPCCIGPQK
ncbi:hypothetical protein [Cyanobium sp. Lug-B]|uniref:hypothetical protein n=1 Tax=Cyanobium sp. Lug-B TaxID=2823716 RepID=UPI0020CDD818|nr:hypothetical protein [Cyanobium sp. Lug-B]MCP9799174.1 hypothetical protein [Cyanobium sp. Lug-B]